MKILLDECVPRSLKRVLAGHRVRTVQQAGFSGYKNGRLLEAAEPEFDLFITSDKNLRYQQNLSRRTIAIILLPTNDRAILESHGPEILSRVNRMKSGEFAELMF